MYSKTEKNYFTDMMLAIIGFVCMLTGIALAFKPAFLMPMLMAIQFKSLHEWTGYVLTILVGWHIIMHSQWIQSVTSNIVKDKKKMGAAFLTAIVAVGICISVSTLTPEKEGPSAKRDNPGQMQKSN